MKKKKTIKVYPLGVIEKPNSFCDILSKEKGHICCVTSLTHKANTEEARELNIRKECIIFDKDGFPDIYIKNKKITFAVMKRGLRLLENDKRNKFRYKLIRKNFLRFA